MGFSLEFLVCHYFFFLKTIFTRQLLAVPDHPPLILLDDLSEGQFLYQIQIQKQKQNPKDMENPKDKQKEFPFENQKEKQKQKEMPT